MSGGVSIWLEAARPKTLWAAVAPVTMAAAMAWQAGVFHGPTFAVILAAALLIQIGTNLANDYFDFRKGTDTAKRIGPTRITQAGLASPGAVRAAFIAAFGLAVLLGVTLLLRGGWPIAVIGLTSVLLGILYTGGPWPLAYIGAGDVFAFLYFGPIASAGTWYLMARTWTWESVIAGAAAGCFSAALLTVNNYRDIVSDARGKKRTLAVRFGPGFARAEFFAMLAGAVAVPILLAAFFGATWWLLIAAVPVLARGFGFVRRLRVEPSEDRAFGDAMNRMLAEVGRLEILYALLFSIAWLVGS
jgi:1,4-dihydroxy-2-naphthoate octaprenyltransferase